jgi:GntR family transcriptional regulator, arabinose operon transcriptional repressor
VSDIENEMPLYRLVFKELEKLIIDGVYPEGSKIPTEKELMQCYHTSRITVSRAVRELESLAYVKRLKAKGTFVNSRALWDGPVVKNQTGNRPFISIVFPAPVSKIALNMEVFYGVELACREQGFGLSVTSLDLEEGNPGYAIDKEKDLIGEVINSGALGAIILPYSSQSSPEMYNRMIIHAFPFVIIDRKVFGVEAPYVSSDNNAGFYTIVEHLISKGHRNIAFVSGNTYGSSSRSDRFSGYLRAMNNHRLPVKDEYIIHHIVPFDYNRVFYDQTVAGNEQLKSSTISVLERLMNLPEPPTALAATNDYIALYTMNIAREMGIRIPEDLSITGFDNLPICSLFSPRLTTVSQNFSEMGRIAVRLLDKVIKNPQKKAEIIQLETKLILGATVQPLY